MSSKATVPAPAPVASGGADADGRDGLRRELERQGVSQELAGSLAADLAAVVMGLGPEARRAAVRGAALASGVQQEQADALRRSQKDLAEIERMMESFASELKKVDEAMQILSTFVARIRAQSAPDPDRIVH